MDNNGESKLALQVIRRALLDIVRNREDVEVIEFFNTEYSPFKNWCDIAGIDTGYVMEIFNLLYTIPEFVNPDHTDKVKSVMQRLEFAYKTSKEHYLL